MLRKLFSAVTAVARAMKDGYGYGAGGDRILDLPDHLLEEILVRLPATTLGQAQLVSKRWRRIISDRCFVLLHARRWSAHPQFLVADTLVLERGALMRHVPLGPAASYTSNLGLGRYLDASLRATCSGLAVFTCDFGRRGDADGFAFRVIAVGNPTTKSYVGLPVRLFPLCALYGLAFDVAASATAFTVVVLETCHIADGAAAFSVITYPELKWRRVEHSFADAITMRAVDRSVYCAGKLHWPVMPGWRVLVFDVATDEVSLLDHPPPGWHPRARTCLGIVGGRRLSLATLDEGCICIWALADYGGRGMWTPERRIVVPCRRPLTVLFHDGEICVLLARDEEAGDDEMLGKLMVHRVVNGDHGAAQWEDSWPRQPYWNFVERHFPHCMTMLKLNIQN